GGLARGAGGRLAGYRAADGLLLRCHARVLPGSAGSRQRLATARAAGDVASELTELDPTRSTRKLRPLPPAPLRAAEQQAEEGVGMRLGERRLGGIDAGDAAALGALAEDEAGGTEDDVVQVDGLHGWQHGVRLGARDAGADHRVERLDVRIGEPAHARVVALALVVHQLHERRPPGDEADEVAHGALELDEIVAALVPAQQA